MQPVSIALLRFHRLKNLVALGFALFLLMPSNTANATATFYGSQYADFSLLDIVQVNTSVQTSDSRGNPSNADLTTASLLRSANSIAKLIIGASVMETSYVSSVPVRTGSQSSSVSLRHFGVTRDDATGGPVATPQDLYATLLDETVTITASNNIPNALTDTGNQLISDCADLLANVPASGLSKIVEAGRQNAAVDSSPDLTLDEISSQGSPAFGDTDIRIEARAFEDAVQHRSRKASKPDARLLIQLN